MNEEELNFNEEQTILDILSARKEIDEEALRNYFRLIVTIISVEKMIVWMILNIKVSIHPSKKSHPFHFIIPQAAARYLWR